MDTCDIFIKTIDFLIEEIKNVRREKNDLSAQINILERENMILKERIACSHVEESK
jgi:hypothetical protein